MRISILFTLFTFTSITMWSQDGLKLQLSTDAYHIHENDNGSFMFEVLENNTFFGRRAGSANDADGSNGRFNCFFGYDAGRLNTDGAENTFVGAYSGRANLTGDHLTLLGYSAGYNNTIGENNTAIGAFSNYYNTQGSYNTTIGYYSNFFNSGSRNTMIGYQAGRGANLYNSDDNVFIGYKAGYFESGDDKLYIDNTDTNKPLIYGEFNNNELQFNGDLTINVPTGSAESRSEIKFGYHNTAEFTIDYDGSNDKFEIREGNTQLMIFTGGNLGIKRTPTTHDLEVNGTASKTSAGDWVANSDARLKKNIKPLNSSIVLSKLLQLQGITYEWNDNREEFDRPEGEQYGFTAQNIQNVFPELVSTDNEGYLQTAYGTYDAMYIEAIRALTDKIEVLEERIKSLENSANLDD